VQIGGGAMALVRQPKIAGFRPKSSYEYILDHNFSTRNVRKSIKGSKDSDSSLVSNENFSETLCPSGWALGQAI